MEFDLNMRSAKLGKEMEKRKKLAFQRLEKEKKIREETKKKQQEMEEIARKKRIQLIQQEEEAEMLRLEEERTTGGIKYNCELIPYPTMNDGDQVTLPVSALEKLNPQDALALGPLTFELTIPDGARVTHAGVLQFDAQEGTIGIPPKVARSLLGDRAYSHLSTVRIRYVRLGQGRHIKLQPLGRGFEGREMNMKDLFERTLKHHTTLTEGDVVMVRQGYTSFDVVVRQIRPNPQAMILNCDLEVDILPCEAEEEEMKENMEIKKREEDALIKKLEEQQEKKMRLQNLVPETSLDDPLCIKALIRFHNGSQHMRRFSQTSPLSQLFDFVFALSGDEMHSYRIVTNFPRRIFTEEQALLTFGELGLRDKQETFFVEKLKKEEEKSDERAQSTFVYRHQELEKLSKDKFSSTGNDNSSSLLDNVSSPSLSSPSLSSTSLSSTKWDDAKRCLENRIDQELNGDKKVPMHALEPLLSSSSEKGEEKWGPQLMELLKMGFCDKEVNIRLLDRYQGRLIRVINVLSEMD